MDMDKNLLLVQMIEKFPCLYKSDSVEYSTRHCTEKAWREVSKELKLSVIECKEKWKNLRYGLLRSLRPMAREGCTKKKYYLHDEMQFLIPYVGTAGTKSKKKINYIEESEDYNKEDQVDSFDNDRYEISQEVDTYNVSEDDPLRKKIKTYHDTKYHYNEQEKNTGKYDDSRKMFLLSLLPEIADFSENQMKTFRRRILGLVDEINEIEIPYEIIKSEPL